MDDDIEKLRLEYESLRKVYSLPEFSKLADDFDIEKIAEKELGSYILRDIRKTISEKVYAYLHLFENFINPGAPPMFLLSILKNMSEIEKSQIKELYSEISKSYVEILKLDTSYNEKEEAEFINKICLKWNELKPRITKVFEKIDTSKVKDESKRGYYG